MKRELPHAYLDDRLLCAGSCDLLPKALEITKQVDDSFGAVLKLQKVLFVLDKNSRRVTAGSFVNSLTFPGRSCILELTCSWVVHPGVSLVCE